MMKSMPKFKLPAVKLNWWLAVIILVGSLAIGLIVWRIAVYTPPVDAAAGDTPTIRALNSGVNPYTATVTGKPAPRPAYEAGDIMMLFITADYGAHTGTTLPTGFTEIGRRSFGTDMLTYIVGYKVATSSEPTSYSYTVPANADSLYSIMSVSDADNTVAPAITSAITDVSNAVHSAPSVYPIASNDLMLSTVTLNGNIGAGVSWTPAAGMTERVDQQVGTFASMIIASEPLTNTGETGHKTHRMAGTSTAAQGIGYGVTIKGTRDMVSTVLPDSTSNNTWTGTHTNIDETGVPDGVSLVAGANENARSGTFTFQDPVLSKPVDYVQLKICAQSYTNAIGTIMDTLGIQMSIGGTPLEQETITPVLSASMAPTGCKVYTFTYYGNWTQAQLANMQVNFTRNIRGTSTGNKAANGDDLRIEYARVRVLSHDAHVENRPVTSTPTIRDIKSANVASATASKTVARPTVQQGDLMIAILGFDRGHLHETSLPSGFTEISWLDGYFDDINTTIPMARAKVGIKVATASEPTNYTYSVVSSANSRIDVVSIAGADTSAIPSIARRMTPKSATSHRAASVYPSGRADLLLATVIKAPVSSTGVSWTPPASMTENSDSQVLSGITMTTASETLAHGDQTGFREFTQTTGSDYSAASFNIAVKGVVPDPPAQDQSSYRFYDSAGEPLAAQDTAISVQANTFFRLRQLVRQTQGTTTTADGFKLQAGVKGSTCSEASYSDINSIFGVSAAEQSFQDDFTFADTAKWTGYATKTSVVNGRLYLQYEYGTGVESNLTTQGTFDMTNKSVAMEVISATNSASTFGIDVYDTANAGNRILVSRSGAGQLKLNQYSNGALIDTVNVAVQHNTTSHRYWRLRVDANNFYFEMSPDSTNWTVHAQSSRVIPINSMKTIVYLREGATSDSGTATVDDFSIASSGSAPLSDEASITTNANDPTPTSGAVVPQSYSLNPAFSVKTSLQSGQNGLWEFALKSDPSVMGSTYCFKVVKSDGTSISSYTKYPEVTFASQATPGATLDQQLRGGQSVVNGQKNPFAW